DGNEPGLGFDSRENMFSKDGGGNEIRPKTVANLTGWQTYTFHDKDGYYTEPFEYYFKEGENTIGLQSVGDVCYIHEFTLAPKGSTISYEEYQAEHKGAAEADVDSAIYLNAETPAATSDYTIYPITDHTSSITEPQSATKTFYNTIGSDKWTMNGQWIRYQFEVEKTGLYTIDLRYKQSINEGLFSSRSLKIGVDGEDPVTPFEEAESIRFAYGKKWKVEPLSDDDGTVFEFYFEAGHTYTIQLEACLGDMAEILKLSNTIMSSLNDDYLEFTKLTGTDPDTNRSYGFSRIMPDVVADLSLQSQSLRAIMNDINQKGGIKSQTTAKLDTMIELLRKMGADESKIAANLTDLNSQISTLGEWIAGMTNQPLEVDYILIQPASHALPKAESNFFQSIWFEIKKFFASFFTNYDKIGEAVDGTGYDGVITVWTSAGREQAQIVNSIITSNGGFVEKYNVACDLKLVAGNTLIPAILAGTAPDVSIDASTPLDFALRGAVLPLSGFDTFDEVVARFPDSAMTQLSLYGETFAIPTTMGVPVMFYRTDILADLGLDVPQTWEELMSMVPVLQFNNMQIGMSFEFATFIFQNGASYWKDDGMRIGFDETSTLDAFETLTNYFTQYSLPFVFNYTRFRQGEMPIMITTYTQYNTLVVSAPEILGLWEFTECPGVERVDENGKKYVDHTVAATSSGIIMPKSTKNPELAWRFIDWYTSKDPQLEYCNEMVALLGPSAKQAVANKEAFFSLPWTSQERQVLQNAFETSKEIEVYPGDYFIVRYFNFAFNKAYSDGADPSDSLLEYVSVINEELTRKRKEFGYMVAEEWDAVNEYLGDEVDCYYGYKGCETSWMTYCERIGIDPVDGYKDWMKEHGITSKNYLEWSDAYRSGATSQSYKDWLGA
ncbi:MAG: extracellular solute-binding protein, partial [Clostridia bacterium]|nr:extracellular solute-binding protein [Clostridia bacterium]